MGKLSDADCERIKALRAAGVRIRELAARFRVSGAAIHHIISGKRSRKVREAHTKMKAIIYNGKRPFVPKAQVVPGGNIRPLTEFEKMTGRRARPTQESPL